MTTKNTFIPEWCSPPGDTVADILDERNISLAKFSQDMEWSIDHAQRFIIGELFINSKIAHRLAKILGASSEFWMCRENQYRDDLSRQLEREDQSWLRHLPLTDLRRFGWISEGVSSFDLLHRCRQFFDVADAKEWKSRYEHVLQTSVFRTSSSFESKLGATASWLRQGEIEGLKLQCGDWNLERFKEILDEARSLTRVSDPSIFISALRKLCADCGVALVTLRTPKGCSASGATRFISPNRALLLLSFRYLSDDHFWFSFFHEAGHLVLHSNDSTFIDGEDMVPNILEEEANNFSASVLIPKMYQAELPNLGSDVRKIVRFARVIGVSRGIVVGQLQYRKLLKPNYLNKLKIRYQWSD